MYANYTTVRINDEQAARRLLSDEVVPTVSGVPGFVAGYWLAPQNGKGNAVIVFESEEAASGLSERIASMVADTVTLDSGQSTSIGINDSVTATGIPAGTHRAALGGVPDNCSVSGDNPRTVAVPPNDTARTRFSVACTPPATQLAFTIQPPSKVTALSDTFQVEVAAEDSSGSLVWGFTGEVTVAIGTDGSIAKNAQLRGTTHASLVNGIATFPNLSIDQTGVNYTLKASVPRLTDATSRAFSVVVVP